MRPNGVISVLLFVWCSASAAPSTALLTGPDEVSFTGSTYSLGNVPFELEIRWEEEIPLELDLYLIEGRAKAGGHFVTFSFKDSSGVEAEIWDIVGSYGPAQGEIRVFKGQTIKIGITGHGWAKLVSGEKYTLSAVLHGRIKDQIVAIEGRKEVTFIKILSPEEKKPNSEGSAAPQHAAGSRLNRPSPSLRPAGRPVRRIRSAHCRHHPRWRMGKDLCRLMGESISTLHRSTYTPRPVGHPSS